MWTSSDALESARRLNRKCLALLVHQACALDDELRELWLKMDERTCERAASLPVLVLDLRFQDLEWWRRASAGDETLISREPAGSFPAAQASNLIRDILVEARIIARKDGCAASLVFDLAPGVAAVIAGLSSADDERIAGHHATQLRLRWADRVGFWRNLLLASIGDDDEALSKLHLHALQLLDSEPLSLCG